MNMGFRCFSGEQFAPLFLLYKILITFNFLPFTYCSHIFSEVFLQLKKQTRCAHVDFLIKNLEYYSPQSNKP